MKVKIKIINGVQIVPIEDVSYVEANSPYSYVHLKNGTKIFCVDTLKMFDEKLRSFGFFRIHKSYLINVSALERYIKNGESYAQMYCGGRIKVSRSTRQKFSDYLEEFYL